MVHRRDQLIREPIPFLSGKYVVILDGQDIGLPAPPSDFVSYLQSRLEAVNYQLVNIPMFLASLPSSIREYLYPGFDAPDDDEIYRSILQTLGLNGKTGFLFRAYKYNYFRAITGVWYDISVEEINSLIEFLAKSQHRERRKREPSDPERQVLRKKLFDTVEEKALTPRHASGFGDMLQMAMAEDSDERFASILTECNGLMKKWNLTPEQLQRILLYLAKPVQMCITGDGRIVIPDLDNKEIQMNALEKALYFFYLRHDEGVKIKDLCDYESEIFEIYSRLSNRSNLEALHKSVHDLVSNFSDNVDPRMTGIRRAFIKGVGQFIAPHYCIEGKGGDLYRIALQRNLVKGDY